MKLNNILEEVRTDYTPLTRDAEGNLRGGFGTIYSTVSGDSTVNNCACGSNNCNCMTGQRATPVNNCTCPGNSGSFNASKDNCGCETVSTSNNCNCDAATTTKSAGSSSLVTLF